MCSLRGSSRAEPRLCRETVSEVSFSKGKGDWAAAQLQLLEVWGEGGRLRLPWLSRCLALPPLLAPPLPLPAAHSSPSRGTCSAPILSNLSATPRGLSAALLRMDRGCHHTLLLLLRHPTRPASLLPLQPFPLSLAGPFSSARRPNVKGLPLVPGFKAPQRRREP